MNRRNHSIDIMLLLVIFSLCSQASATTNPPDGAEIFANKLCWACHGEDGSGGAAGVNVQGKSASSIFASFDPVTVEEVHSGNDVTVEMSNALAAFLAAPGPLPIIPESQFVDPLTCRICHPRQYVNGREI